LVLKIQITICFFSGLDHVQLFIFGMIRMAFIIKSNNCFIKNPCKAFRFRYSSYANVLYEGLTQSRRSDLARSITLIETGNPEKKKQAQILLKQILEDLKQKRIANSKPSLRIGYKTK